MQHVEGLAHVGCLLLSGCIDRVAICRDGKWGTRKNGDEAGELPSAKNVRHNAVLEPGLAGSKRQLIGEGLLVIQSAVVVVRSVVMALIEPECKAAIIAILIAQSLAPREG